MGRERERGRARIEREIVTLLNPTPKRETDGERKDRICEWN